MFQRINAALTDDSLPPAERLNTVRVLTHMQARTFLKGQDEEEAE